MAKITAIRDELSPPRALNHGSATELRRAAASRHSMLLEGPEPSIEAVLLLLAPYLRKPMECKRRGAPLELPADDCGVLLLRNVACLDATDQVRLLLWLNDPRRHAQVVSTTSYPLFPLVCSGVFNDTLYYRLNLARFSFDLE